MRFLRTNTAVIITVGPFLDKSDGVTLETALTITNEKITLTADTDDGSAPTNILDNVTGATSGTSNDLNYITGNDAGMMQLELSAANTNRLGRMFLSITDAANHLPVFHEFMVLPAMIYDAFILGTDVLQADMTQILGTAVSTPATAGILDVNLQNIADAAVSTSTAQLGVNVVSVANDAITAAAIGTGAIDADAFAADAIGAAELAADAIAEIKAAVVEAPNTDTYAEPGQGAPAATTTLVAKIGYLYKACRNKSTQTASQYSLFADDATTVDQKATFADDATTATRGEVATGP